MRVKHRKTGKIGNVIFCLGNDSKITNLYDIKWEDNSVSREPLRNIKVID